MTGWADFFHVFNLSGAILGFFTNCLLIFAIYATSKKNFHPYSQMFLVAALFDVFFSGLEIVTQNVSHFAVPTLIVL
jgi:hypothetical protein